MYCSISEQIKGLGELENQDTYRYIDNVLSLKQIKGLVNMKLRTLQGPVLRRHN